VLLSIFTVIAGRDVAAVSVVDRPVNGHFSRRGGRVVVVVAGAFGDVGAVVFFVTDCFALLPPPHAAAPQRVPTATSLPMRATRARGM
jgi:hypothetical protein